MNNENNELSHNDIEINVSEENIILAPPLWSCLMRLRNFHRVLTLVKSFRLRFSTTPIKKNSYCLCSKQYDSIVTSSNVIIGRGYAEIFKDIYLSAKQAKSIHTSL